jgi:ribosomal protein S18 acetylase RimI-like enzyme
MQIRRMGPNNVADVVAAAPLFDDPPDPAAVAEYLADDRNLLWLAEEDGRAVGFLRGTALRQIATRRPQMFLYEVAVDPDHRRRGVGRALVDAMLGECRRRGFEEAFVFTDPANTAAVALYRSTGGETETPADRMYVYRLAPKD